MRRKRENFGTMGFRMLATIAVTARSISGTMVRENNGISDVVDIPVGDVGGLIPITQGSQIFPIHDYIKSRARNHRKKLDIDLESFVGQFDRSGKFNEIEINLSRLKENLKAPYAVSLSNGGHFSEGRGEVKLVYDRSKFPGQVPLLITNGELFVKENSEGYLGLYATPFGSNEVNASKFEIVAKSLSGQLVEIADDEKIDLVNNQNLFRAICELQNSFIDQAMPKDNDLLAVLDIFTHDVPTVDLLNHRHIFKSERLVPVDKSALNHGTPLAHSRTVPVVGIAAPINVSVQNYLSMTQGGQDSQSPAKIRILYNKDRFRSPPVTFSDTKVRMEGGELVIVSPQGEIEVEFVAGSLYKNQPDRTLSHGEKKEFRDAHNASRNKSPETNVHRPSATQKAEQIESYL